MWRIILLTLASILHTACGDEMTHVDGFISDYAYCSNIKRQFHGAPSISPVGENFVDVGGEKGIPTMAQKISISTRERQIFGAWLRVSITSPMPVDGYRVYILDDYFGQPGSEVTQEEAAFENLNKYTNWQEIHFRKIVFLEPNTPYWISLAPLYDQANQHYWKWAYRYGTGSAIKADTGWLVSEERRMEYELLECAER